MRKLYLGFGVLVFAGVAWFALWPRTRESGALVERNLPRIGPAVSAPGRARGGRDERMVASSPTSASHQPRDKALGRLQASSDSPWIVRRSSSGRILSLAEGRLGFGISDPMRASEKFLKEYGRDLFGVAPESAEFIRIGNENGVTQMLYRQACHGTPVHGSRLNFFFDRDGRLIHAVIDSHEGECPQFSSQVDLAQAAASVRAALDDHLRATRRALPDEVTVDYLKSRAQKRFRLVDDRLSAVFLFVFSMKVDRDIDFESMIDARTGDVVVFREITIK